MASVEPNLRYAGYTIPFVGKPDLEITQTSRGTPGGEYLRRFWQPVAYLHEVERAPMRAKIMGEDLVIFKDGSGAVGVLHLHCQHRGTFAGVWARRKAWNPMLLSWSCFRRRWDNPRNARRARRRTPYEKMEARRLSDAHVCRRCICLHGTNRTDPAISPL